jgi:hypothetical protein
MMRRNLSLEVPSNVFLLGLAAGIAALAIGAMAVHSPVIAAAPIVLATIIFLLFRHQQLPREFLMLLGILLVGYAFFGRGFAHLGISPIYVGEIVLVAAILVVAVSLPRARVSPLHVILIAFMFLGVLRTVPYFAEFGIDSLRDAVLWGYGIFAIAVSTALRREHLQTLARGYGGVLPYFLLWAPVAGVMFRFSLDIIPTWPMSDVPIIVFKGGDIAVHLAGGLAFVLLGLAATTGYPRIPTPALWSLWIVGVALVLTGRAALLILLAGGLAVACFRLFGVAKPTERSGYPGFWLVVVVGVTVVSAAMVDLRIEAADRDISPGQIVANAQSIFRESDDQRLYGTTEWRQEWWDTIVNYTVHGPYFWTGKGFGINLADADGFQTEFDGSVRSPHNGHMTVLARMGVPGLVIWLTLQVGFAIMMMRTFFRSLAGGDRFIAQLSAVVMVYWTAMTVNSAFDVYLEGPQGGIWFWTVFGVGLALMRLQREREASGETSGEESGSATNTAPAG